MGATSSSDNPYGYRNGGNGLTAPIQYPNRFTARNDITGDAIRTGNNSAEFDENFDKVFNKETVKYAETCSARQSCTGCSWCKIR